MSTRSRLYIFQPRWYLLALATATAKCHVIAEVHNTPRHHAYLLPPADPPVVTAKNFDSFGPFHQLAGYHLIRAPRPDREPGRHAVTLAP